MRIARPVELGRRRQAALEEVRLVPADRRLHPLASGRACCALGDHRDQIWGLKFVMDGGVAGAGMNEPFVNDPGNTGHINWDPAAMSPVVSHAVANGWRVAAHAVGDRAVRLLLDVYESALAENPDAPPGTLVPGVRPKAASSAAR